MNYIYGQLNQKVVKIEYEGISTDTSTTSVDNKGCAIGVDVRCVPYSLLINDEGRQTSYNGSSEVAFSLHNYTVSKLDDAGEGNVAAYELKKDGVKIGDTIEIPTQAPITSVSLDEDDGHFTLIFTTADDSFEVSADDLIMSCEGSEYILVDRVEGSNTYTISLNIDDLKSELDISGIEGDIDSLQDRVDILERDIATKQDALEAGDNISISGGVISAVDTTYSAGNGLSLDGTQFSVDTTTIATKGDVDTKQDVLSEAQLNAVNSGITTAKREGYDATVTTVGTITTTTLPTINNSITSLGNQIDEVKNDLDTVEGDIEDEVSDRQDADDVLSGRIDDAETAIAGKQDTLTAGANITIENNEISATDTTYTAGTGLDLTGTEFSVDETVIATKQDLESKQDTLTQAQQDAVDSGITATILSEMQSDIAGKQDTLTFDAEPTEDSTNPVTSGGVFTALEGKQDTLTAGEGITIEGNEISAEGKEYFAGTGLSLTGVDEDTFAVDTDVIATKEDLSGKQDTLDAGDNIIISGNEISAIDTTYEAGFGIKIADDSDEDEISAISIDEGIVATKLDLEGKQDVLTAGDNITIEDGVISSSGKIYSAGYGIDLVGYDDTFQIDTEVVATKNDLSGLEGEISDIETALDGKQDTLTPEQLAELNSGITEQKVADYDAHINNQVIHCTQEDKDLWDSNHLAPEGELNIEFNADVPSTVETAPLQNILVGDKNYKIYGSGDSGGSSGGGDSVITNETILPSSLTYANPGGMYAVNLEPEQKTYIQVGDAVKNLYFDTRTTPDIAKLDFKGAEYTTLVRFVSEDNYEWRQVYTYSSEPAEPKTGELWLDIQYDTDEETHITTVTKTLKRFSGDIWAVVEYTTELPQNPEVGQYYISNTSSNVFIYTTVVRNLLASAGGMWGGATIRFAYGTEPDEFKYYLLNGVIYYYDNGAWVNTHYVLDDSNPEEGQHFLKAEPSNKYTLKKYTNGAWYTIFSEKSITLRGTDMNTTSYYMGYDDETSIVRYIGNSSYTIDVTGDHSGPIPNTAYDIYEIPFDVVSEAPSNIGHLWWEEDTYSSFIKGYAELSSIVYSSIDLLNEDISISESEGRIIRNNGQRESVVEVPVYFTPMGSIGLFTGWYFKSLNLNAVGVGTEPFTVNVETSYKFKVDSIPQNVFTDSFAYEYFVPSRTQDLFFTTQGGNVKKEDVYGIYTYLSTLFLYKCLGLILPIDTHTYTIETSDWVAASSDYSPFTYTYTTPIIMNGQTVEDLTMFKTIEIAPQQAVLIAKTGIAIVDVVDVDGDANVVFGVLTQPSEAIDVVVYNRGIIEDFVGMRYDMN